MTKPVANPDKSTVSRLCYELLSWACEHNVRPDAIRQLLERLANESSNLANLTAPFRVLLAAARKEIT